MSRQPQDFTYTELIHDAFTACQWRFSQAYRTYLLNGGEAGPDAFRSWINGKTGPQPDDLAILCHILRQRLEEIEVKEVWLPDLPLPRRGRGGDGLTSTSNTEVMGRYLRAVPDLTYVSTAA